MPRRSKALGTVLVLTERPNSKLTDHLRRCGYEVLETFTTDHAVAICVNTRVDVAVLNQDCFVETDGWSVAQSLKAAKPGICVLLALRGKPLSKRIPKGVDATVSASDADGVLAHVESLSLSSTNTAKVHGDARVPATGLQVGRRKRPR
jgi:hypothetical protein